MFLHVVKNRHHDYYDTILFFSLFVFDLEPNNFVNSIYFVYQPKNENILENKKSFSRFSKLCKITCVTVLH